MVRIRKSGEGDSERIDAFYASSGSRAIPSESHIVLIAEHEDAIVGAVRLCIENSYFVLRTMIIGKDFRRQGIGKQMLVALEDFLRDQDCYCLPYAHLIDFYGSVGFVQIGEHEAPAHLRERYQKYVCEGNSITIMRRPRG